MKIIVVGSCQAAGLANCLSLLLPGHEVETRAETADMSDLAATDAILLQAPLKGDFTKIGDPAPKIVPWPIIMFSGFHPDIIHISDKVPSPTSGWHSSICMAAWKQGLSPESAHSLYREEVFEVLGFFSYYPQARRWLASHLDQLGFPGRRLVDKWCDSGCFMHGVNHPKVHVLADIALMLTEKLGLPASVPNPEAYILDNMLTSVSWPVFPPISERLGLGPSQYLFKARNPMNPTVWRVGPIYDLMGFIKASYEAYEKAPQELLVSDRFLAPAYKNLASFVKIDTPAAARGQGSPYSGLADYQFWRRVIERTPPDEVDPVVVGKFKLTKSDRIATAGSCFAQHISRTLNSCGFNYYVVENIPPEMTAEEGLAKNCGVFSARFGNIYTARQLLQLIDRSYARFAPRDKAWARNDGRWADPFRPAIEPEGFASPQEVEEATHEHLSRVRTMFETLDVFVFTLGLTEGWRSRIDGAVFPLAPGVAAGEMDSELYEFVNFSVADTVGDLDGFVARLRSVNPGAKIILTVSPVPLIATYENRHVLVSTTYSKSVLRAAAEEVAAKDENIAYFPSYEIITGAFNRGAYYEDDLRSVRSEGVQHVMSLFLRHYTDAAVEEKRKPHSLRSPVLPASFSAKEAEEVMAVVCDEVWMDD